MQNMFLNQSWSKPAEYLKILKYSKTGILNNYMGQKKKANRLGTYTELKSKYNLLKHTEWDFWSACRKGGALAHV